jgi:hypothetical protein
MQQQIVKTKLLFKSQVRQMEQRQQLQQHLLMELKQQKRLKLAVV